MVALKAWSRDGNGGSATNNGSVTVPAGVSAGDVMILITYSFMYDAAPTGWTRIRYVTDGMSGWRFGAYYKIASANDAGTVVYCPYGGIGKTTSGGSAQSPLDFRYAMRTLYVFSEVDVSAEFALSIRTALLGSGAHSQSNSAQSSGGAVAWSDKRPRERWFGAAIAHVNTNSFQDTWPAAQVWKKPDGSNYLTPTGGAGLGSNANKGWNSGICSTFLSKDPSTYTNDGNYTTVPSFSVLPPSGSRPAFAKNTSYTGAYDGQYDSYTGFEIQFASDLPNYPGQASNPTPSSGTVTTGRPQLGLTLPSSPAGKKTRAQWQLSQASDFSDNVITVTESESDATNAGGVVTEIPAQANRLTASGTWFLRGRALGDSLETGAWSSAVQFTLGTVAALPTPSLVTPTDAGTLNSSTPTITGKVIAGSDGQLAKLQFQLAKNSGFTDTVRTITTTDQTASGDLAAAVSEANKLSQGTWYIRVRALDQYGTYSPYSSTATFTVAHPASSTLHRPTGGSLVEYAATARVRWNFADTYAADTQSAYRVVVERNDNGNLVVDSGKITSAEQFYDYAYPSNLKDVILRWKVQTWDADNTSAGYSQYNLFALSDPPTVSITTPPSGQNVESSQPKVEWTFVGANGKTQKSYQVTFTEQGSATPAFDSGVIQSSLKTYTPSVSAVENQKTYVLAVTATDIDGLSTTTTRTVAVQYNVPAAIVFTAEQDTYAEDGYVRITWLDNYESGFVAWRIYRRPYEMGQAWTLVTAITQATTTEYRDWYVPSGQVYEYVVVQLVSRFGQLVESYYATPQIIDLTGGGGYWLLDPYNENNNVGLSNVTSDSYSKPREQSSVVVVGRGRHVEKGESAGMTGSLSVQLRDRPFLSAREQKRRLEALVDSGKPVYLRNPFGDTIMVSIGDISVNRIPGVGQAEFTDVEIPYEEIYS